MATLASRPSSSAPTSRLDEARRKFNTIEKVYGLRTGGYLEDDDIDRIPSDIPVSDEELTAFMQQLFQYGVKKWMPGCPVRLNTNVVSVRLDGMQFRRAQEIRQMFEKNGIRNYVSQKNSQLYRTIESNVNAVLRGNGYTEFVQEEGRDFYHIPSTVSVVGNSGLQNVYQSIVLQGRHDRVLNESYEPFMALVTERNEERRREFIRNRTQLNAEYIQHVVNTLTIPFEHLNNPEMVAALQEAGLVAFIKQPTLNELVSTDIMVDVFSAPNEEDETWKIMPVTPEIVESSEERLYHGQGTITAYDATSAASKNGTLPYVIQHCLRAGADMADFLAILPEEFRNHLGICNEIYLQFTGDASSGLDKAALERGHQQRQREAEQQISQQSALEAILEAPTVSSLAQAFMEPRSEAPDIDVDLPQEAVPAPSALSRAELDRLIADAFAQPVPEQQAVAQAQNSVVDSLTEQLLAQIQQRGERRTVPVEHIPASQVVEEEDDDDLPFEPEPVVVVDEPQDDALYHALFQQLQQIGAQARPQPSQQQQAQRSHHESYGNNPIFTDGVNYVAFRGQEGRMFANFNEACIYAGKLAGTYAVYNYANATRAPLPTDTVWAREFNGQLF